MKGQAVGAQLETVPEHTVMPCCAVLCCAVACCTPHPAKQHALNSCSFSTRRAVSVNAAHSSSPQPFLGQLWPTAAPVCGQHSTTQTPSEHAAGIATAATGCWVCRTTPRVSHQETDTVEAQLPQHGQQSDASLSPFTTHTDTFEGTNTCASTDTHGHALPPVSAHGGINRSTNTHLQRARKQPPTWI